MGRAIGAFVILAAFAVSGPAGAAETVRAMTVTGTGRVTAVPDIAVVSLGVQEQARTARAATDAMAKSARSIMGRISAAGIEDRDVQTSGLSLNPVYSRKSLPGSSPELTGFRAATTLAVRVRKLDELGDLLDQLVTAGANTFQGVSFDVSARETLMDEARQKAVADALRKARLYAESAKVELGDILSISESPSGGMPRPTARVATMSMEAVPVAAGETEVTSEIQMRISINSGR